MTGNLLLNFSDFVRLIIYCLFAPAFAYLLFSFCLFDGHGKWTSANAPITGRHIDWFRSLRKLMRVENEVFYGYIFIIFAPNLKQMNSSNPGFEEFH